MKKRLNVLCLLMLLIFVVQTIFMFEFLITYDYAVGSHSSLPKYITELNPIHQLLIYGGIVVTGLICIYVAVRSTIYFIKFILNINRNKVFIKENIRYLRWIGWGYLTCSAYAVINTIILQSHVWENLLDQAGYFIFAIFGFIIAEVFSIGIKLREEQELTI